MDQTPDAVSSSVVPTADIGLFDASKSVFGIEPDRQRADISLSSTAAIIAEL
jgi:hypothetical protein